MMIVARIMGMISSVWCVDRVKLKCEVVCIYFCAMIAFFRSTVFAQYVMNLKM